MSERIFEKAGKWSTAANWSGGAVPKASDDVVFNAASPKCEVTVTAKCRSLNAELYKNELVVSSLIEIGTTTEAPSNIALKFGAGMTLPAVGGEIKFMSTSKKEEKIFFGGKEPQALFFEGVAGVWKLEEECKCFSIKLEKGTLNLNGQTVEATTFHKAETNTATLKTGAASIKIKGLGELSLNSTGLTLEASECTVEFLDTTAGQKEYAVLGTIGTLIAKSCVVVVNTGTFKEIQNNTAGKPKECKATLVEGSNVLTVTSGEAELAFFVELEGKGIPAGTEIAGKEGAGKWIMSANATETVAVAETVTIYPAGMLFAQGQTYTVTTFTTNGKAGELSRIASRTPGKSFTLHKASGNVSIDYMRIRDSTVDESPKWYAGTHSVEVANDLHWLFEAEGGGTGHLAGTTKVKLASSTALAALAALTATTKVKLGSVTPVAGTAAIAGKTKIVLGSSTKLGALAGVASTTTVRFSTSTSITAKAGIASSSTVKLGSATTVGAKAAVLTTTRIRLTGSQSITGTAGIVGTLEGATKVVISSKASLTGKAGLLSSTKISITGAGTFAAKGALAGSTRIKLGQATRIAGTAGLAGATKVTFATSAAVAGTGGLAGGTTVVLGGSASIEGTGVLVVIAHAGLVNPKESAGTVSPTQGALTVGLTSPRGSWGATSPRTLAGLTNPRENDAA